MGGVRFALGGARGGPEGKRCRRDCCTVLCGVLGKRRVRFFPSGCLLWSVLLRPSCVRGRSSPRGFLLFFLIDISSASSSTKFMYSSNPCQVKQRRMSTGTAAQPRPPSPAPRSRACAHNDPPLDPHVCVLIEPDLHTSLLRRGSWAQVSTNGVWRRQGARRCRGCSYGRRRRRTFCRNLKIRFCASDAREGGAAQLFGLFGGEHAAGACVRGGRCRGLAAHDRLCHDLLDLGRHGSQS